MSSNDSQTLVYAMPKTYSPLDLRSYKALVMALPAAERVEHILQNQTELREEQHRINQARDKLQKNQKALYTKRENLIIKDLGVLDRALRFFGGSASTEATPTATQSLEAKTPAPASASDPPGSMNPFDRLESSTPSPNDSQKGSVAPSVTPTAPPGLTRPSVGPTVSQRGLDTPSVAPAAPPGLTRPSIGPMVSQGGLATPSVAPAAPPGLTRPSIGPMVSQGGLATPSVAPAVAPMLTRPSIGPTVSQGRSVASSLAPAAPPGLTRPSIGPSFFAPGHESRGGSSTFSFNTPLAPPIPKASAGSSALPTGMRYEGAPSLGTPQTPLSVPAATAQAPPRPAGQPNATGAQATVTRFNRRYDESIEGRSTSTTPAPLPPPTAAIPISGASAELGSPLSASFPPRSQPTPVAGTTPSLVSSPGLLPVHGITTKTLPPTAARSTLETGAPALPGRAGGKSVTKPPPAHRKNGPAGRNPSAMAPPLPAMSTHAIPVRVKQEELSAEHGLFLRAAATPKEAATSTIRSSGTHPAPEKPPHNLAPPQGITGNTAGPSRPNPHPVPRKPKQLKQQPNVVHALPVASSSGSTEVVDPRRVATMQPLVGSLPTHGAIASTPLQGGLVSEQANTREPVDDQMRLATVKDEAELNNLTRSIQETNAEFDRRFSKAQHSKPRSRRPKENDGNGNVIPGPKKVPSKASSGGSMAAASSVQGSGKTTENPSGKVQKRKRHGEVVRPQQGPVSGEESRTKKRRVTAQDGEVPEPPQSEAREHKREVPEPPDSEASEDDGEVPEPPESDSEWGDDGEGLEPLEGEGWEDDVEDDVKPGKGSREAATEWGQETQHRIVDETGPPQPIVVRVLKPVNKTYKQLAKLLYEERVALHNHVTAGISFPPHLLLRARKFRHVLPEIAALSRLSIIAAFIHQSKMTRCHRHTVSDRASATNDETATHNNVRKFAVTGVPLRSSNEVQLPPTWLKKGDRTRWWVTYKKVHSCRLGATSDLKTMPTKIGGLNEKQLLQFYRFIDGKYYLHCGCELESAIFDFFIWKTMPPLTAPFTQTVECIGNPFDPRTRAIVISLLSSFGFGPGDLDSAFKYNRKGKANDLSKAPPFVQTFWKEREAQAKASLEVKHQHQPMRTMEYLEIDDLEGPEERDPFGEEEEDEDEGREGDASPKLAVLANDSDGEGEEIFDAQGTMDIDDGMDGIDGMEFDIEREQRVIVKEEDIEGEELPLENYGTVASLGAGMTLRETVENGRTIFVLDDSGDEDEDPEATGLGDEDEDPEATGLGQHDPDQSIMEVHHALLDGQGQGQANGVQWKSFDSDCSALTELEDDTGSEVGREDGDPYASVDKEEGLGL